MGSAFTDDRGRDIPVNLDKERKNNLSDLIKRLKEKVLG